MGGLDAIDRKMIDSLRRDGRMSAPALAERLAIGRATAYTRLDRLFDVGIIDGFTARVDPVAVGLTTSALVLVNVEQGSWRDLRDELCSLPGVEWVAAATGRFDFVLLARSTSLEDLRDGALAELQQIDGVRSAETIILLDEVDQRHHALWP